MRDPTKAAAHAAVAKAIRLGEMRRPERCSKCNRAARIIEGHHDDYSKPLCVRWLCKGCHTDHHCDLGHYKRGRSVQEAA